MTSSSESFARLMSPYASRCEIDFSSPNLNNDQCGASFYHATTDLPDYSFGQSIHVDNLVISRPIFMIKNEVPTRSLRQIHIRIRRIVDLFCCRRHLRLGYDRNVCGLTIYTRRYYGSPGFRTTVILRNHGRGDVIESGRR